MEKKIRAVGLRGLGLESWPCSPSCVVTDGGAGRFGDGAVGSTSSEGSSVSGPAPVSQRRKQKAREEMACPQAAGGGGRAGLSSGLKSRSGTLPRCGGAWPCWVPRMIRHPRAHLLQTRPLSTYCAMHSQGCAGGSRQFCGR